MILRFRMSQNFEHDPNSTILANEWYGLYVQTLHAFNKANSSAGLSIVPANDFLRLAGTVFHGKISMMSVPNASGQPVPTIRGVRRRQLNPSTTATPQQPRPAAAPAKEDELDIFTMALNLSLSLHI